MPEILPNSLHASLNKGPFNHILQTIQYAGYNSFGAFLLNIFNTPGGDQLKWLCIYAQAISSFLGGRTNAHVDQLIELMCTHKD